MPSNEKITRITADGWLCWFCPACRCGHGVPLKDKRWTWDGNRDAPTLQPSVSITAGPLHCHFYVTAGKIQFLHDCKHALADKTVAMETF